MLSAPVGSWHRAPAPVHTWGFVQQTTHGGAHDTVGVKRPATTRGGTGRWSFAWALPGASKLLELLELPSAWRLLEQPWRPWHQQRPGVPVACELSQCSFHLLGQWIVWSSFDFYVLGGISNRFSTRLADCLELQVVGVLWGGSCHLQAQGHSLRKYISEAFIFWLWIKAPVPPVNTRKSFQKDYKWWGIPSSPSGRYNPLTRPASLSVSHGLVRKGPLALGVREVPSCAGRSAWKTSFRESPRVGRYCPPCFVCKKTQMWELIAYFKVLFYFHHTATLVCSFRMQVGPATPAQQQAAIQAATSVAPSVAVRIPWLIHRVAYYYCSICQ